ncbi:MAG: BF3164 family lipoprotein [Cyclobacteriaceae bacterium]
MLVGQALSYYDSMNLNNCVLISLLCFLGSCLNKDNQYIFEVSDLENGTVYNETIHKLTYLEGKVLNTDSQLVRPRSILVTNDEIILSVRREDSLIQVLSKDGKYLRSFMRKGSGPNEAMSAMEIGLVGNRDRNENIFVYDGIKKSIFKVMPDSIAEIKLQELYQSVIPVDDTLLIAQGLERVTKFSVIDYNGNILNNFGENPEHPASNNPFILNQAYNSTIKYNKSKKYLLSAAKLTDRIEFYNIDDLQLKLLIRGPVYYEPIFHEVNNNNYPTFSQNEQGRFSFVDFVSGKETLYFLYSGYSREERPGIANFGDKIFCFDSSGNAIAGYQLDHYLLGIDVDEINGKIYGIDVDTYDEEKIIVYDLTSGH